MDGIRLIVITGTVHVGMSWDAIMGCDRVLSVAEIPYIFMGTHTVLLVPEPVEPDRDYGYIQLRKATAWITSSACSTFVRGAVTPT